MGSLWISITILTTYPELEQKANLTENKIKQERVFMCVTCRDVQEMNYNNLEKQKWRV